LARLLPRIDRALTIALLAALTVLLVEVLFEAWVQELLGNRSVNAAGKVVGELPGWPKDLKNGLLIGLVAVSAAKLSIERRWRELTTRADAALGVLIIVMVVAGLLGTSGPVLIGEAVFVYLRGAVVFYAIRALRPTWRQIRAPLVLVAGLLGLNVAVAVVQAIVGLPAFRAFGWVDLQQAMDHRAQGLFDHPNHLGHVLGLALLGIVAWMTGLRKVSRAWWLALGGAALGVALSQSRESMVAALCGIALIWLLRRSGGRTALAASTVVIVLFAGYLVARPGNLSELGRRLMGVVSAVETPSGTENCDGLTSVECVDRGRVKQREVRVLFYQQGARLLVHRPVLGYGVGQFGGIVAEEHDPNWQLDPRFPGGFDLHDFDGTTVDSFWLHLTVETGVIGLLAYLAWLWLVTVPLLGVTRRFAGRRVWGAARARAPAGDQTTEAVALWGPAAVLFTVVIGFFSSALEDALYPTLAFTVLGIGWVLTRAVGQPGEPVKPEPAPVG
jgi:hypothetical protein